MNTHFNLPSLSALALLGLVACGEEDTPESPGENLPSSTLVDTTAQGSVYLSSIDGTDQDAWVYVSLAKGGTQVEVSDAATSTEWDLAFRRSNIKLNGGASGPGMAETVPVSATTLSEIVSIPSEGWMTDTVLAEDPMDGSPVVNDGIDFAFARTSALADTGWFSYDPTTHVLTPAPLVWVVRGADGATYALRIVDWYDMAGTSAVWSVEWKTLTDEGSTPAGLTVDASADWVYVSLADGVIATPADPMRSTDWDLAFSSIEVKTNSGVSGPGFGGARLAPSGATWDGLSTGPTSGFASDTAVPGARPGTPATDANAVLSEWWNYDATTHVLSPKSDIYLLLAADGSQHKLRITGYSSGVYTVESAPLTTVPDVFELSVDASASDAAALVSLREGAVVDTSSTGLGWDLAITRTVFQTNSGVSGPGQAGAVVLADLTDLASATEAPADGYQVDALVDSGRPNVPAAPANPVLAAWYDYDTTTHAVSPKAEVYAVRTADGRYVALEITSYADGQFGLRGIVARPGTRSFQ